MGKKEIDYMDERLKKQLDFALEICTAVQETWG